MKTALRLAALFVLAACAGYHARQEVLLPSLRADWAEIRVQVLREAAVQGDDRGPVVVAAGDAALEAGDAVKVAAVSWSVADVLAAGDIDRRAAAHAIGPNVAILLREQLAGFRESRAVFTRGTTQ